MLRAGVIDNRSAQGQGRWQGSRRAGGTLTKPLSSRGCNNNSHHSFFNAVSPDTQTEAATLLTQLGDNSPPQPYLASYTCEHAVFSSVLSDAPTR